MALHIEKSDIDLAAIYRPLNNKFLNFIMERVRKNIFVKIKSKKEFQVLRNYLHFKKTSIALMIDQRVSQGIKSNFF